MHTIYFCGFLGFSFSGCYSSQQLSQNTILLITIKFQDFSRLLYKIQGFQGLEFGSIKFKAFQDFQGPVRTLCSVMKCTCKYVRVYTSVCVCAPVQTCVSACVSACVSVCVDVCTYHKTSRQLIVLTLTTSSSMSLLSRPQLLRLL